MFGWLRVNYLLAKERGRRGRKEGRKEKKKNSANMSKQQDANNAPPAVRVNLQMCPSVPPERENERKREGEKERGRERMREGE